MAARRVRGNVTLTFNSVALTNYINSLEESDELERIDTTHFGSTGAESIVGDTTYGITISGDWDVALDTALMPEVITPGTKRTLAYGLVGSTGTRTLTWTSNAELESYSVKADVGGKIGYTATFALSGAPVRSVA